MLGMGNERDWLFYGILIYNKVNYDKNMKVM